VADVAQLHTDQVEYWNGAGGARWIASQSRRERMLGDFALAALKIAAPQPGESVIDVGCGCGETSVELAKAVGPTGKVLAADVSALLLAEAKARLAPYAQATAVVADASAFPFESASADLLFSRFGVMFFGDPVAAFKNLRKALKPDGRMTFACWRAPRENPWMTGPLEPVFSILPRPPAADPDAPGPFAFQNSERVAGILTEAGFAPPKFEKFDPMMDVSVGQGVEGAIETTMEFGPTSRIVAEESDETRAKVAEALKAYFAELQSPDGSVRQAAAIWIVSTTAA
jgi:SAM-dependent methyltransferase